jgi:hypothetical protein
LTVSAVRWWWALGGARPVDLHSPLQAAVAAERLAGAARRESWLPPVRPTVVGRVRGDRVRLARARAAQNSWRPVLRGRLVAAPLGCRLVGEVAVQRAVRWTSRSFVVLASLFALSGVVGTVVSLSRGGDASPLLLVLAGVGMAAFIVVVSGAGLRFAEDDGPWLVAWAAEQLDAPAPVSED